MSNRIQDGIEWEQEALELRDELVNTLSGRLTSHLYQSTSGTITTADVRASYRVMIARTALLLENNVE